MLRVVRIIGLEITTSTSLTAAAVATAAVTELLGISSIYFSFILANLPKINDKFHGN